MYCSIATREQTLLRCMGPDLALRVSSLRCSDSVRYVRYFCRADEATGMPLVDPYLPYPAYLAAPSPTTTKGAQ